MADETVSATDSTDDELAAVAGVLYLASAELDDYGASVSEKNGGRWGCRPGNGCARSSIA
jgi:hypothetical protein